MVGIKGWEMPESCQECYLKSYVIEDHRGNGFYYCNPSGKALDGREIKPDFCPLMEGFVDVKNCLNNLIQLDDLKKEVASYGDTLWSTQDILNMINDIPVAVCNCNTKEECYNTIFDLFGIVVNNNSSFPDTGATDEEDIKRLEKYKDYLWSLGTDATEEEKKDLQSFRRVITALKLICLNTKEEQNEIS